MILNVDLPCAAVVGLVGLASVTWSVGAYNGQRGATEPIAKLTARKPADLCGQFLAIKRTPAVPNDDDCGSQALITRNVKPSLMSMSLHRKGSACQ